MAFKTIAQKAARRIAKRFGEPAIYQQLDGFETDIDVVIDKGVRPFAESALNTHVNDTKTVATILVEQIEDIRKGELIVTDGGEVFTTVHVLKSDGYCHQVIVK